MKECLTLKEFLTLSKTHSRVVVFQEVVADTVTPISVYHALVDDMQGATLLESVVHEAVLGRYSFLGFSRIVQFAAKGCQLTLRVNGETAQITDDPWQVLRALQQEYGCQGLHPLSGFSGGAVGYLSYDAIRLFEGIPDRHPDEDDLPDLLFNFYPSSRKTSSLRWRI